jgi:hypothetical protein
MAFTVVAVVFTHDVFTGRRVAPQGLSFAGGGGGLVAQILNVPLLSPPFSQTLIYTVDPGVRPPTEI